MNITPSRLKGVFEVKGEIHKDFRGKLARTFDFRWLQDSGISFNSLQESISYSEKKYTLRGIHVSLPPFSEGKLIAPISGTVQWMLLDLRKGSSTYKEWISMILSEDENIGILVPKGFAHGCLSLTDKCSLLIKSDSYFSADSGTGILWKDPLLDIKWQLDGNNPIISERDSSYKDFIHFESKYGGVQV
ncbi:MAG: hypothetical protein A2X45_02525 [Lentisphaerae bacterium GWF2_50_93]|nr:MAG: hypothetical protein A2X45_02525 [Lentisphaerae bacterium GWF2_50_93]